MKEALNFKPLGLLLIRAIWVERNSPNFKFAALDVYSLLKYWPFAHCMQPQIQPDLTSKSLFPQSRVILFLRYPGSQTPWTTSSNKQPDVSSLNGASIDWSSLSRFIQLWMMSSPLATSFHFFFLFHSCLEIHLWWPGFCFFFFLFCHRPFCNLLSIL